MASLLDQSVLTDLAERLVSAARRAGADTADAVAVRSMSLSVSVRDGEVEESERAEGDDVGLRVFVGRRQAVVSSNDTKVDASQLAERAVAMARVAPEDAYAGLADPDLLGGQARIFQLHAPVVRDLNAADGMNADEGIAVLRGMVIGAFEQHGIPEAVAQAEIDAYRRIDV